MNILRERIKCNMKMANKLFTIVFQTREYQKSADTTDALKRVPKGGKRKTN